MAIDTDKIYKNAITEARILMKKQTEKNKAPSWLITELAVRTGKNLADEYGVNTNIVVLTLYLQHIIFSPIIGGEIQKNHPKLSANYVEDNKLLVKWKIPADDRKNILQAIRNHHNKTKSENLIVEVIKNAECQKFVTVEGALIWLHELGIRGYNYEKSKELVFYKMEQKKELLTLEKCIKIGEKNCKEIKEKFEKDDEILRKLHDLGLKHIKFELSVKMLDKYHLY